VVERALSEKYLATAVQRPVGKMYTSQISKMDVFINQSWATEAMKRYSDIAMTLCDEALNASSL
jgi:hypothetical protein